jgi:hypothetical protein
LDCDWSTKGISGTWFQAVRRSETEDSEWEKYFDESGYLLRHDVEKVAHLHPISYSSRKLIDAETRYPAREGELL